MTSLALLQLVSPALPVGAFSYSEGLEHVIQTGLIKTELEVCDWLESELRWGSLRLEAAALSVFQQDFLSWLNYGDLTAATRLVDLDGWLLATREASEVRAQQRQMGCSLLELMTELGHPLPEPCLLGWPAAWAWAATVMEISAIEMVQGYLFGWVANQLSAAVRLLPLGPTRAQVLQRRLSPLIIQQATFLLGEDPRTMWSSGLGASMAQLAHSELYSRLFRS